MSAASTVAELHALRKRCAELEEQLEASQNNVTALRSALGAYRSALRSGEPESDQMREMGNAAIDASYPAKRLT